jgi:D-aminopeptidase
VKVLISVDVEGISGVATRRETATGWPAGAAKGNDYERAPLWMPADANAAIGGAFKAVLLRCWSPMRMTACSISSP